MLVMLAALVASLAGCDRSTARFHSNLVQMTAANVTPKHQKQIADILEAMYGTPDDPFVLPESGLNLRKIKMAAGPVHGHSEGLFRLHCVHCHGITGDALGPTSEFLKPYPRDYREGWYKFKSTPSNQPPTEADLMRTLTEGVPGTAMPSFKLLSQVERESLVEYVKYLSLRGQTELALIEQYKSADEFDPDKEDFPTTHEFLVEKVLQPIVDKWKGAASQVTQVPAPPSDFGTPSSIDRGKQVFFTTGGCVKCHGPTELGDGQQVYDMWNEPIDKLHIQLADRERALTDLSGDARSEEVKKLRELQTALETDSLPPRKNDPRNLRQGIFRGGRQPYEIFYKLHNGIFPSQMPGIATTPGMTMDDIWHLVDFVLDLPYEPGSQYHTDSHMMTAPRERL